MRISKIAMVEPRSPANHVFTRFALPRLGLPILGTIAAKKGYDVKIVVEEIASIPAGSPEMATADLLCISTITPTASRAYELADQAHADGIPVVLGGPHATYLPDEAMGHADWVLRGEAEASFPLLLDTMKADGDLSTVPGLTYRVGGEVVSNELDPNKTCLDDVPPPDFGLITGRGDKAWHRGIIPVSTSRGCPHRCQFCSVTPMFGHRMRFASNERVAEELARLDGKGNFVFFYDDNFCASPRRTKSLLDHLMTQDVPLPPWISQVSVRAARDLELLRMMERASCHTVCVGFESINPAALSLYNKRQAVDDIREAIRRFHQHHIGVHGMFVFGSDADDVETIRETARFAIEEGLESVQFLVLTPLPGTPLFDQMRRQDRLLTTDWSKYDTHHTVYRPARMTPYELTNETMKAMAKVYSLSHTGRFLLRGDLKRAAISRYAAHQVVRWRRENGAMMRQLRREERRNARIEAAINRVSPSHLPSPAQ